jgi:hypothetical protein
MTLFIKTFLAKIFLLFALSDLLYATSSQGAKLAYLGVYTSELKQSVSHQLDLPPNLYLCVEQVAEGSPAQKAGIQKFDILLKLNDQILVNPDQLKYLVHSKNPDERLEMTLVRKGKKKKIVVILGEIKLKDIPDQESVQTEKRYINPGDRFDRDLFSRSPDMKRFFDRHPRLPFPRSFFDSEDLLENFERITDGDLDDNPLYQPEDIQSFSSQSNKSQMMVTDDEGTLEWSEENGKKSLRVTDPVGKILFDGPIDSEEERESLPPSVARRLEKMEQNMNLK